MCFSFPDPSATNAKWWRTLEQTLVKHPKEDLLGHAYFNFFYSEVLMQQLPTFQPIQDD
jgi:hypothetical protein